MLTRQFSPPQTPRHYSDRPRLYHLLERWPTLRAILLHAPAGYGKSTLVSRWLARAAQIQAAWIALDATAADPRVLVRNLAMALEPLVPGALSVVQPILSDAQASPQRALEQLLAHVEQQPAADHDPQRGQILLVLDDVHLIDSAANRQLLKYMIEFGPARLHLILLGRTPLNLRTARLSADEAVIEITPDELRFNVDELRAFLSVSGYAQLGSEQLDEIMRRSEGWIMPLRIALIAQPDRDDIGPLINSLRGDHRRIAEYLIGEVLAQQPASIRRALLTTSILDSFNAALFETVCAVRRAKRLLDAIIAADLFVVNLDNSGEWFRYHHLFQELLQRRLAASEPEATLRDLHRRAAAWLAEHHEIEAAVRHLLAAGDDSSAAALVTMRLPAIALRDPYRARGWFDLLPEAVTRRDPALLLERCRLEMLLNNRDLLSFVEQAEAALAASEPPPMQAHHYRAMLYLWRSIGHFLRAESAPAADNLRLAQAAVDELDDLGAGCVEFMLMHLNYCSQPFSVIQANAFRALATFERVQFTAGSIAVRRELARYAFLSGLSEIADECFETIFISVEPQSAQPLVTRELLTSYLIAAQNSYWQGKMTQARAYQQRAAQLAQRLRDFDLSILIAALGTIVEVDEQLPANASGRQSKSDSHMIKMWSAGLQIQSLLKINNVRAAWRIAADIGIQPTTDPAMVSDDALHAFLMAYIARGVDLEAVSPLLERALNHYRYPGGRFTLLRLLTLQAWQHLRMRRPSAARSALTMAVELAEATGYVRAVMDIPELLPLLSQIAPRFFAKAAHMNVVHLTPQERSVLHLLAKGYPYATIAQELKISLNTVRTHVRHVYRKLGASRRIEALERARAVGTFL